MRTIPKSPTAKNSAELFTGEVWVDRIASPEEPGQRMSVALVRFSPGAHTAWHSHKRGQTLHITSGTALIGTRDGTVIRATPGQTVYTPAGEEHWHGASPENFMEHLAMLENGEDPTSTATWLEHVSIDDYRAASGER